PDLSGLQSHESRCQLVLSYFPSVHSQLAWFGAIFGVFAEMVADLADLFSDFSSWRRKAKRSRLGVRLCGDLTPRPPTPPFPTDSPPDGTETRGIDDLDTRAKQPTRPSRSRSLLRPDVLRLLLLLLLLLLLSHDAHPSRPLRPSRFAPSPRKRLPPRSSPQKRVCLDTAPQPQSPAPEARRKHRREDDHARRDALQAAVLAAPRHVVRCRLARRSGPFASAHPHSAVEGGLGVIGRLGGKLRARWLEEVK
ncbi:hypothetical protein B0A49_13536, partial [Cryomyces minteri]